MDEILTATSVISVIVLGVTQIVKQTAINNKWLPFLNVVFGLIIGTSYALTIVQGDIAIYAWAGILAGMSAGGFYDLPANGKLLYKETKINEGDDENE
ncbi:holin [Enterococcus sp. C65]|uniref:holin n=1 Tax=Enterococcus TaxID=1350 RepID=UPI0034A08B11